MQNNNFRCCCITEWYNNSQVMRYQTGPVSAPATSIKDFTEHRLKPSCIYWKRGKGAQRGYTFLLLQHPVWSEWWPHQISASLLTPIFNALSILSDVEHWFLGRFCVLNRTYFAWQVFGGRLYISTDLQKAV